MSDRTGIEWADATWNPIYGCTKVSAGCDNCYAVTATARLEGRHPDKFQGLTKGGEWTNSVQCLSARLEQPARWREEKVIFVNSLSDLFHPGVSYEFICDVLDVMTTQDRHQYLILTKRPRRMLSILKELRREYEDNRARDDWFRDWMNPAASNIFWGVSIESDKYVRRADALRKTPVTNRFLSLEPLLGPLPSLNLDGIDWVIVGGESGPKARPMHPAWARDIRDRCDATGIPFFFKQWGEWVPEALGGRAAGTVLVPSLTEDDPDIHMLRVGRRDAGRLLDGRTHDEQPVMPTY